MPERSRVDLLVVGDGASVHTRRHAAAMASQGKMSVVLAAFEGDPIPGVPYLALGARGPEQDLRYLLAIPTLARAIRRLWPRIIHAHYVSSYGLLTAAARRLAHPVGERPPLVISAWGADLLMTARTNWAWTTATAATLRAANLITLDSIDLDAEAKALAASVERIRFVWGPPAELFAAPAPTGRQVVVARALVPHTRVDLVVRAFRLARRTDPLLADWRLAVVGDGPAEAAVRAAAAKDPAVQFHGRLSLDDLRNVLRGSRIFANVPASDATSAVLLDSLAIGNVPVVNDLPAYREWIDGEVGEVTPRDPTEADLAAAISRAARREIDPDRIRERVRPVSWDSQVTNMLDAYKRLLAATPTDKHRILATYERRTTSIDPGRYSLARPGNALALEQRERILNESLARRGISSLASLDILEIGCGTGNELSRLVDAGAEPARLSGIDLREDAIAEARARVPGSNLVAGDASRLPYPDKSFDLVYQATALSSMPARAMRTQVAAEMRRVVRPGGLIVSYDFAWNPPNRQTVGIGKDELNRLFPKLPLEVHRVTLVPPLARWLGDHSQRALHIAARIAPLRSHRLAILDVPR
jgi:ubiquinone/menaquinone biosynthesis C-methylase UbiE/glycosyltransferase involved in cell wall biosynthesis